MKKYLQSCIILFCLFLSISVAGQCPAVSIASQPSNQTKTEGSSASFSVSVYGTADFSYIWYKNEVYLSTTLNSTSNTNTLTTPSLTAANNGDTYYCIIQNCSDTKQVKSNTVTLTVSTVCTGVTITSQPESQTANNGSTASFSISANGSAPYTYIWYKNEVYLSTTPNSTSNTNTLTTPELTAANSGDTYFCVVQNCSDTKQVKSNTVTLTVNSVCADVTITSQPESQTANNGSTASISISANGTAPYTYIWYKNGVYLSTTLNSTSSANTLTTPELTAANSGDTYYCIVQNCSDTKQVKSSTVTLTMNSVCAASTITSQPVSQSAIVGSTASFSITADGTAPYTYIWYKNEVYLSTTNSTSKTDTLTTPELTSANNGDTYYCLVQNCSDTKQVRSNTVTLTVNSVCTAATIIYQPENQTAIIGGKASFSIAADGTAPYTYIWYKNGVYLSTTLNSTSITNMLTTPELTAANSGDTYYCIVQNCSDNKQVKSNTVTLTINSVCAGVAITSQPKSQTTNGGSTASFSISANGSAPYTYIWYKNGVHLSTTLNSTSSANTLTTPELTAANSGDTYYCIVQNCGDTKQVKSNTVTLTVSSVCADATITSQPESQTANNGNTASFSISANGSAPYTYIWYKNGVHLSTTLNSISNTNTLTTTGLTAANNDDTYYCIVQNCSDTKQVKSNTVTFTINSVCAGVTITSQPKSQTTNGSSTASFSISTNGTAPYTYIWYKNGVHLSTTLNSISNTNTLTTTGLTAANNGDTYYCIVQNCSDTKQVKSDTVTLTVKLVTTASTITNQNLENEIKNPNLLIVFPNPNNGEFTTQLETKTGESILIEVINQFGQRIFWQQEISPENNYLKVINLGNTASGIYFVRAKTKSNIQSAKIILID